MSQTRDECCAAMRRRIKHATEKRETKTAVFFAEKLVTLSPTPEDVFVYAQALFDNKEFRRAATLIVKNNHTLRNMRFACLVGRSLLECKAYEECITTIGGEDENDERQFGEGETPSWKASLYVIRASAWEALDNLDLAVMWYKKALKTDPLCYEAFHALLERNMMSQKEGTSFLEGLSCTPDMKWVTSLYSCMNAKYAETIDDSITKLKDAMRFLASSAPLRPSDHTNRSRHSQTDSVHSSSPGFADQPENLDIGVVESAREGLDKSIDVQLSQAEWYFSRGSNIKAYIITKRILRKSEEILQAYPLHLAVCMDLNNTTELYAAGQNLAKLCPDTALSFYAFGVYEMAIQNYSGARKAFSRSNALNKMFAPAWIGLGNAFAAQSETEQALAAYRTAQTLFPGHHLPSMYIGMENLRLNLLDNARVNFETAYNLCPGDPMPLVQLGMVCYYKGEYSDAADWFHRGMGRVPSHENNPQWEPVYINLGHAMRKEKRFGEAMKHYSKALTLSPMAAGTHTAIGLTYHLQNRISEAVDHYMKALIQDPQDMVATELSEVAAKEALDIPDDLFT